MAENEEHLDDSEKGIETNWLKTQFSKNEDHKIWSHYFMAKKWLKSENKSRFYFLELQNHCGW